MDTQVNHHLQASPGGGNRTLASLVQQIGDILRQGEVSETPTHHSEQRSKLRAVLLNLVDLGVRSESGLAKGASSKLAAVLQLLKLTLEKVPHWFSGDGNAMLLEILDRLVPVLARPMEPKTKRELTQSVAQILIRAAATDAQQFRELLRTLCDLFQDAYDVAVAITADPHVRVAIRYHSVLLEVDDNSQTSLEIPLNGQTQCLNILQGLLCSLAEGLVPFPAWVASEVGPSVVQDASALLSCSSLALQAASMQFLTTIFRARSPWPFMTLRLVERLRLIVQTYNYLKGLEPDEVEHWFLCLNRLLHALMEASWSTDVSTAFRKALLCVGILAALECQSGNEHQTRMCYVISESILREPTLASTDKGLVQLMAFCSRGARKRLLVSLKNTLASCSADRLNLLVAQIDPVWTRKSELAAATASGQRASKRQRTAEAGSLLEVTYSTLEGESSSRAGETATEMLLSDLLIIMRGAREKIIHGTKVHGADVVLHNFELLSDLIEGFLCYDAPHLAYLAINTISEWPEWKAYQQPVSSEPEPSPALLAAALRLLTVGLQRALKCYERGHLESSRLMESLGDVRVPVMKAIRGESPAGAYGLAISLLAASFVSNCGSDDQCTTRPERFTLDSLGNAFEGARSSELLVQKARAGLLPAAALLASRYALSDANQSHQTLGSGRLNPFSGLMLRMASGSEPGVVIALIRGLRAVLENFEENNCVMNAAIDAVFAGTYVWGSKACHDPIIQTQLADWVRPILEVLCSDTALDAVENSPDLVAVVALFLKGGGPGQLERSRAIATWALNRIGSVHSTASAAALAQAHMFAKPEALLTLYHAGNHPTHSVERLRAADKAEQQLIIALRDALQAAGRDGPRAEDVVQAVAHIGVAFSRGCSVKDLIVNSPRLLERVGKHVPHKPALLHEMADLMDMSPSSVAISILPRALPPLLATGDRDAIEKMAHTAGMTVQSMLTEHGHHILATSLMTGDPNISDLVPLLEDMIGQDIIALVKTVLPRTISEMVSQAGTGSEWSGRDASQHFETVVQHTADMLSLLVSTSTGTSTERDDHEERRKKAAFMSEYLADGDHVTRMLKEFGDRLEHKLPKSAIEASSGDTKDVFKSPHVDVAGILAVLRSVTVLVQLTGQFVGRFLPHFMVLFGAAARVKDHKEIVLEALRGWSILVGALDVEAPAQLIGVAKQVIVAVLDSLHESGAVSKAATQVVDLVIDACHRHSPESVRTLPPIPVPPGLSDSGKSGDYQQQVGVPSTGGQVGKMLQQLIKDRKKLSTNEHVQLLIDNLADHALAVRVTALQELRALLAERRDWALGLYALQQGQQKSTDARNEETLMKLLAALLKASEPEAGSTASSAAQQASAECLGMLGAIDPARIKFEAPSPPLMAPSLPQLGVQTLRTHLVRLLKTAPNLQTLDAANLAIQDLLKHYKDCSELQEQHRAQLAEQQSGLGLRARTGAVALRQRTPGRIGTKALHAQETNSLFAVLPEDIQAIVRPYLDSRYSLLTAKARKLTGVVFGSAPALTFRRWLATWLSKLIENHVSGDALPLFRAIKPVLRYDISTGMSILPYVVYYVVGEGSSAAINDIVAEIMAVLRSPGTDREAVLCMQAVFTLLDTLQRWSQDAKSRSQSSSVSTLSTSTAATNGGPGSSEEWSRVQSMLSMIPKDTMAKAAASCGAHARALLYYEAHVRVIHGGGANLTAHLMSPSFSDSEVTFLLEVYSRLEEPDGMEGLMTLRKGGPRPEDQRMAAEKAGSWSEAMTLYERDLSRQEEHRAKFWETCELKDAAALVEAKREDQKWVDSGATTRLGYLNCLLQMGHWQGLLGAVDGMLVGLDTTPGSRAGSDNSRAQLAAMGAAAAWRLGRWAPLERHLGIVSLFEMDSLSPDARWEVRLGKLLRDVSKKEGDRCNASEVNIMKEIELARAEVIGPFSAAAMESYTRAYPHLLKFHMLQEIADLWVTRSKDLGEQAHKRALRWDERLALLQPTMTTQSPVLALWRQLAAGDSNVANLCWLQQAALCRSTGHYDSALSAVVEAEAALVPGSKLERAELLYVRGDQHRGISELRTLDALLIQGGGDGAELTVSERASYRAQVLLTLAEWTAETGTGTREQISSLFQNSISLRQEWPSGLFRYAAYLDQLMVDARTRQNAGQGRALLCSSVTAGQSNDRADRLGGKARIKLGEDQHHLTFLPNVLQFYGKSVKNGHRHIYRALPRMLTLWFEFGTAMVGEPTKGNAGLPGRTFNETMALMADFAKSIPMHAWMVVLSQLISRICHSHSEVSTLTRQMVTNVAVSYPQQASWALASVSKSAVPARRSAANAIITQAKRGNDDAKRIFVAAGSICEQLIKLCNHHPPSDSKRTISFKAEIPHLPHLLPSPLMVPVMASLTPTIPTPHPAGYYSAESALMKSSSGGRGAKTWQPFGDLVTLEGLLDDIQIMSSLQKPKRFVFLGSDGLEYPFLAKPKDDLRKDARMMEAAGVINRVFLEEPEAKRRQLYLRRFAVVPIIEDCGIIEWVANTRPMRLCLNDLLGSVREMQAAVKKDYDHAAALQNTKKAPLLEWLERTLRAYPPQFHRWFLEKFPEPAAWLNGRLAFTRTYAVWCMVGHTVGLGDRHGENVLLDMRSGDAIQIDFGCLFDHGITLPMPEMVPFRLTQNVIDGFGVAGVEGVYRKTCETTMSVLRKHRDTVLTIMESFVHDPLVEWVNKEQRRAIRNAHQNVNNMGMNKGVETAAGNGPEVSNPQAKDALLTIDGRLRGTLLGVSSRPCMPLSVQGHVDRLIQEAGSKENLSKMYIWWQAWY